MGRHENALEIYVHRLQDYTEAEEYVNSILRRVTTDVLSRHCKRVYRSDAAPDVRQGIFLVLLRIYLRPPPSSKTPASALLPPALALISRHSPRLDAQQTIQLLPPLVSAGSVKEFLCEALRQPKFDTRVVRNIWKARSEEVSRKLVALQERRVRIDDTRM